MVEKSESLRLKQMWVQITATPHSNSCVTLGKLHNFSNLSEKRDK